MARVTPIMKYAIDPTPRHRFSWTVASIAAAAVYLASGWPALALVSGVHAAALYYMLEDRDV